MKQIQAEKKSIDLQAILNNETFLYILKRFLQAALTLLIASALCFAVIKLTPGNCLDAIKSDPRVSRQTVQQLTKEFGLDKPNYIQYLKWLWQVVTQFNFGQSCIYYRPVGDLILERIPNTLYLSLLSIVGTWAIAIPLGIISAVKQNSLIDRILRVISYLGQGFPSFIPAIALLLFAQLTSPLFPVGNMTSINYEQLTWFGKIVDIAWHSILPTIALSITGFAGLQRLMRGQLLDVLRQEYIQTARAKGLPENKVIYTHALRNAINPLITLLGFEFASLLGGAFIAEQFFNWPGLGRLTLQAVFAKDVPVVMATLMMGAGMLIVGNLLADLLLKVVDPRIKLEDLK